MAAGTALNFRARRVGDWRLACGRTGGCPGGGCRHQAGGEGERRA